jgi:growth arrest-specific protein 1
VIRNLFAGMWWVMVSVAALVGAATSLPCEQARMRCAYRVGCGMALQNYVVGCSGVLQGPPPTQCPEICHHSLIALTSTEEGKDLMNCKCSDEYCEDQKLRSEICRPEVMKTIGSPVVSCRVAQWICAADTQCSTALKYYNQYCRAMFHGKKCTPRCNNSISILRRQEKAAKLTTCKCDGFEDYDCRGIQKNMAKLCFHKHNHHHQNATRHVTPEPPPPVAPPADVGDAAAAPVLAFGAVVLAVVGLVT